ncbi:hypothetical protein [Streptosporangium sandarakinum]
MGGDRRRHAHDRDDHDARARLGAIFRNGVVAISVLVVLVPFAGRMLPGGEVANRILPGCPALQLIEQMPDVMPDAAAFAVLGAWAVVPLLVAVLAGERVS